MGKYLKDKRAFSVPGWLRQWVEAFSLLLSLIFLCSHLHLPFLHICAIACYKCFFFSTGNPCLFKAAKSAEGLCRIRKMRVFKSQLFHKSKHRGLERLWYGLRILRATRVPFRSNRPCTCFMTYRVWLSLGNHFLPGEGRIFLHLLSPDNSVLT